MVIGATRERIARPSAAPRRRSPAKAESGFVAPRFGHRFERVPAAAEAEAARGVRGGGEALPFRERIQASFGAHDISTLRAHRGPRARSAAQALGAEAFAARGEIAFGEKSPSLHTAAHEAAHALHQRHGARLARGLGNERDAFERHADAAADLVVAGRPAAPALDRLVVPGEKERAPAMGGGVQRKVKKPSAKPDEQHADEYFETAAEVLKEICGFNGLIADLVKTFEKTVLGNIRQYVTSNKTYTVDEVAEWIVPNVIVGELHTNPDGRNFFLKHLGDFQAAGIHNVVLEFDGSTPAGAGLILQNKALKGVVEETTTLQEASDLAADNLALRKALGEMLVMMWQSDVPFSAVLDAAFKQGMRVVFGDYTPSGSKLTDAAAMKERDKSFVQTLAGLWKNGQRAVVIVGALHMRGMQQGLKDEQVPNLALNLSGLDLAEAHALLEERERKKLENKKKFTPKFIKVPTEKDLEKPPEKQK